MILALILAIVWAVVMTYLFVKARGDYFDLEMKLRESERLCRHLEEASQR